MDCIDIYRKRSLPRDGLSPVPNSWYKSKIAISPAPLGGERDGTIESHRFKLSGQIRTAIDPIAPTSRIPRLVGTSQFDYSSINLKVTCLRL